MKSSNSKRLMPCVKSCGSRIQNDTKHGETFHETFPCLLARIPIQHFFNNSRKNGYFDQRSKDKKIRIKKIDKSKDYFLSYNFSNSLLNDFNYQKFQKIFFRRRTDQKIE